MRKRGAKAPTRGDGRSPDLRLVVRLEHYVEVVDATAVLIRSCAALARAAAALVLAIGAVDVAVSWCA